MGKEPSRSYYLTIAEVKTSWFYAIPKAISAMWNTTKVIDFISDGDNR